MNNVNKIIVMIVVNVNFVINVKILVYNLLNYHLIIPHNVNNVKLKDVKIVIIVDIV